MTTRSMSFAFEKTPHISYSFKLQSWTKVLGQIYICDAFSHAPNKQSGVNSSTLVQALPPTMLETCTNISPVSTL